MVKCKITRASQQSSCSAAQPIELDLIYRIENGKRHEDRRAEPNLVLTWEEFFMGLAELKKVYCNDNDSNPSVKVHHAFLCL